ncbi:MAG TPA: ankyrin repeat domain-containing protein, partial [Accumulibacter sp.]|uniref:ankyrin repeat domain-containing protein n=1 Tax=Accumulibacter sp. TaxID=2053492 RepID=UPI002C9BDF0E
MLAATMLAALAIGSAAAEAAATNGNGREGGNPGPPGATAGPGVPAGSGAATEDRRTPFERNCSEHDRTTALLHAANRGDAEMVSVLLAHGADRTLVDRYGRTALDFARMSVHPEVLRVLAGGEAKAVRRSAGEDLVDKGTPPQAARSLNEAWRFDAPAVIARGPFLVDDA